MKRLGSLAALAALCASPAAAQDVVRLGNLKFAHYGAVSYMKEIGPKYGLRVEERVFPKGSGHHSGHPGGRDRHRRQRRRRRHRRAGPPARRSSSSPASPRAASASSAAQGPGLTSVTQLKGKKVGVPRGGAQELLLFAELAKAGLTWSEQPGEGRPARLSRLRRPEPGALQKQIDAMCQSEPQSAQAIAKGYRHRDREALRHARWASRFARWS